MLAKVRGFALNGLDGIPVDVEVDAGNGLPAYGIVGLADMAVKESKERVRAAVKNSGMRVPNKKITVNLAPADVRKEGSAFDLAIAVALLKASDQLAADTDGYVFLGELSLDGGLRRIVKVARTIADMAGETDIKEEHILEAVSYRGGAEK